MVYGVVAEDYLYHCLTDLKKVVLFPSGCPDGGNIRRWAHINAS
jgi:hypothetical protein